MSDRRRTNRFVVPEAAHASLRLLQDVYVELVDTDSVVIVTDAPVPHGEELVLELPCELGVRTVMHVTVAASNAVWVGHVRRHRLLLQAIQPTQDPTGDGTSDTVTV